MNAMTISHNMKVIISSPWKFWLREKNMQNCRLSPETLAKCKIPTLYYFLNWLWHILCHPQYDPPMIVLCNCDRTLPTWVQGTWPLVNRAIFGTMVWPSSRNFWLRPWIVNTCNTVLVYHDHKLKQNKRGVKPPAYEGQYKILNYFLLLKPIFEEPFSP